MLAIVERAFGTGYDMPENPEVRTAWMRMEEDSERKPKTAAGVLLNIAEVAWDEVKVGATAIGSFINKLYQP